MEQFIKQPGESYFIGFDFTNRLPSGSSLSSGTVSAIDLYDGATVSSTVLASTSATIAGSTAKVKVQAGTHNRKYKITFSMTLSTSEVLQEDVIMQVQDL